MLGRSTNRWYSARTGRHRAERTAKHHRGLVRTKVGVKYDQGAARRIVERSIRKEAAAKNRPADLINIALEKVVEAGLELPGFSTFDKMASKIRTEVNASIRERIHDRMSPCQRAGLLRLLEERDSDGTTLFNRLKKPAQGPTWSHFKNLAKRLERVDEPTNRHGHRLRLGLLHRRRHLPGRRTRRTHRGGAGPRQYASVPRTDVPAEREPRIDRDQRSKTGGLRRHGHLTSRRTVQPPGRGRRRGGWTVRRGRRRAGAGPRRGHVTRPEPPLEGRSGTELLQRLVAVGEELVRLPAPVTAASAAV
ncbi:MULTISPECIES: DUF4158 domain-containing protein [unclassified Streptomyces]|uniref:DUF4158 domain-containing protein n=1 Tax=unclassified Streptomyces TaxID=2593676 RepID=UPI0037A09AA9